MQWLRLLTVISGDVVQIPAKAVVFFIVSLSKGLSLYFMCSDQHVKYWMPPGFPLTSSLLFDNHIKQYTHTAHPVCYITSQYTHICLICNKDSQKMRRDILEP